MAIYFDNAATTKVAPEVKEVMLPFWDEMFGNPSSIHAAGRIIRTEIERVRKSVANHFNVSPGEIFFTSGGTEANNMAILCAVRDLGVKHIISSRIEHHCVLNTIEDVEKYHSVKVHYVDLLKNGHIDLVHFAELLEGISEKTLVTLMHANNEIGNLLDIRAVATLCEKYNAYFHSDTVQTIGHYKLDLANTKMHFLACGAHKFHGPKGVGFIYINKDSKINPFIVGGSQERNMRAGTENVAGIIGLGKAIDLAYEHLDEHSEKIKSIKAYMIEQLSKKIPAVAFNGDYQEKSLYTVLNVLFPPNERGDMMLFNLDIAGICASGGSACSSGSDAGSHVLKEFNLPQGTNAIRFSFSKDNTKAEVDEVVSKLAELLSKEK